MEPRKDSIINLSHSIIINGQDSAIAEGIKSNIYASKQLQRVYMAVKGFLGLELDYTKQDTNAARQGRIIG